MSRSLTLKLVLELKTTNKYIQIIIKYGFTINFI